MAPFFDTTEAMFDMLHGLDVAIIVGYLIFTFAIGLVFSRRASKNLDEFFVAGRSLPWWIVGTSMVATTFAADTPLVVSGLVAKGGIWKNWVWWNWGVGGIVAVFLFAKLWNRAGITTDAELVELRYDGKPAAVLRAYRAVWFGFLQNLLIIAWVMKAMAKITVTVMGWNDTLLFFGLSAEVWVVLVLFCLTVAYTVMAGLWGVVATDVVQFGIAMLGSIYLAVVAMQAIGGLEGIQAGLTAQGFDSDAILTVFPSVTTLAEATPFSECLVLILVVWVVMYNVDGGGYLAQRLFAAKNERHSVFAYLWYNIAMVCLRPWPWIVVGLCGMVLFGQVGDAETYYPLMMKKLLPAGMFGVMVASFLAAFMSTIDTQLNWGASMLINDLYKRFVRKNQSQRKYVQASRLVVIGLAFCGALVSFAVDDISQVWILVFSVTAGIGTVYICRWYWWRVSAWSEITAFVSALLWTLVLKGVPFLGQAEATQNWAIAQGLSGLYPQQVWFQFPYSILLGMAFVVPAWLGVTFCTRPVSDQQLIRFYRKVYPGGPGWKRFWAHGPKDHPSGLRPAIFLNIGLGILIVNGCLLGVGEFIVGSNWIGLGLLVLALGSGLVLGLRMRNNVI